MKLYQIRTENIHQQDIKKILNVAFDSYTIAHGVGYWQGVPEASLTIEIYATDADAELVLATAQTIKELNKQDAVLVLALEANGKLI